MYEANCGLRQIFTDGRLAKDGTKTANSSTVTVNGRRLFAGSSADTEGANPPRPR